MGAWIARYGGSKSGRRTAGDNQTVQMATFGTHFSHANDYEKIKQAYTELDGIL